MILILGPPEKVPLVLGHPQVSKQEFWRGSWTKSFAAGLDILGLERVSTKHPLLQ